MLRPLKVAEKSHAGHLNLHLVYIITCRKVLFSLWNYSQTRKARTSWCDYLESKSLVKQKGNDTLTCLPLWLDKPLFFVKTQKQSLNPPKNKAMARSFSPISTAFNSCSGESTVQGQIFPNTTPMLHASRVYWYVTISFTPCNTTQEVIRIRCILLWNKTEQLRSLQLKCALTPAET